MGLPPQQRPPRSMLAPAVLLCPSPGWRKPPEPLRRVVTECLSLLPRSQMASSRSRCLVLPLTSLSSFQSRRQHQRLLPVEMIDPLFKKVIEKTHDVSQEAKGRGHGINYGRVVDVIYPSLGWMIVFMFVVSFLSLFSLVALRKYGAMDQTTPSVHKLWSEARTSSTSSASAAACVFPASPASPSSMAPSSLASTPGPLPAASTTKVTSQPSPLRCSTTNGVGIEDGLGEWQSAL